MKQAKRNKEINVARLCKINSKGFTSFINERRIIRGNIGLLTHEQLNNVPQFSRYVGNILDTFIFGLDVQEKPNHPNVYVRMYLPHPTVLKTFEEML